MLLSTFLGCKPLEIKSADKQKFVSGIPNGIFGTNFSLVLLVNNPIKIDSVCIGEEIESNIHQNFELYNLDNGKILKSNQFLEKGKYFLQVFSPKKNSHLNNDVFVYYLSAGKFKKIESMFLEKDGLLMKKRRNKTYTKTIN